MTVTTSLYERLGGAEKIRAIVDGILDAHAANPIISARFENISEEARQHAFEFFAAGTGGPYTYTGRDMRTTHKGMNISEQEYVAVIDDILGVLNAHGVGEQEQQEVLYTLYGLKGEIVRV